MKKVAVIMGSDSDFPVVSKAVAELKAYGVPTNVTLCLLTERLRLQAILLTKLRKTASEL